MSAEAHIRAFAVLQPGADVINFSYRPMPLQSNQVEIDIIACGVCHSDLHQQHNDWGSANFPLVLGHEIIGRVVALGADVKHLAMGQRVGVGPQTGSCDHCEQCQSGRNQLCSKKVKSYNTPTGNSHQPYTYGGFADKIRVRADWAFPIPDALDAVNAAPIMCAGLTTWAPFVQHDLQKGDVVGIIGIGGLGHMALQFSRALGFDTTAISTSANKKDEAVFLGANHFLNVNDTKQYESRLGTFDFLLSTVSADNVDWALYLNLLKPEGKLCMVGLPLEVTFKPGPLVTRNLSIVGSYLAPPGEITKMLNFAAEHHIQAMTERLTMTASNCNLALKNVAENTVRYRMVLVNSNVSDQSL